MACGVENNWEVKSGVFGKGLKKRLDPDVWSALESTYTGAEIEQNWIALFATIALFRKVAVEVGDRLGYQYPLELDHRVMDYLRSIQALDPVAESFPHGESYG